MTTTQGVWVRLMRARSFRNQDSCSAPSVDCKQQPRSGLWAACLGQMCLPWVIGSMRQMLMIQINNRWAMTYMQVGC